MDAPRAAVRLSVLAVAAVLVALVALASVRDGGQAPVTAPVLAESGAPFEVPRQAGTSKATWLGQPVLVVVAPRAVLDGVEHQHGAGEATPAIDLGGGLSAFALSAKSTHRGCTVGFNAGLGASKAVADYDGDGSPDGRMLDPCGHGQWDVYHQGAPQPGTPTNERRMASLRIELRPDGTLLGQGFDGPVGPPPR